MKKTPLDIIEEAKKRIEDILLGSRCGVDDKDAAIGALNDAIIAMSGCVSDNVVTPASMAENDGALVTHYAH